MEFPPGAFEISEVIARGEPLRLVGASRERLAPLAIRLRHGDGLPVRVWTRTVVLGPEGGVHAGVLGANLRGARCFSDHTLRVERLLGSDLVLLLSGHRWRALAGLDVREGGALDVALAPASATPWRLRLRRPDGTPAAGWRVLVGLPFGAGSPRAAAALGTTDAEGAISAPCLPPGLHAIAVPFEGEAVGGEVLGAEELPGRVAWSWAEVQDGGGWELTAPSR